MSQFTHGKLSVDLETLIDQHTLAQVLQALGQVCQEKADHIEVNWQEPRTAKQWRVIGNRIFVVHGAARNRNL